MKNKENILNNNYEKNNAEKILVKATNTDNNQLLKELNSSLEGLSNEQVQYNQEMYGKNIINSGNQITIFDRIKEAFLNPFTIILIVLAIISYITDVYLSPGEEDFMTVIIISTMVILSGLLQLVQETRSQNAAEKLSKMVQNTTLIKRLNNKASEIPMEDVVVGDISIISAGDMIPADMKVIEAKDLFISQSALTGESEPIEKFSSSKIDNTNNLSITEYDNLVFMGSTVISGSAKCVVLATGEDTLFGEISKNISDKPVKTTFDEGVDQVSFVLIRFMLIMVPIVFVLNGITKKDWLSALLFSISIAVGLTPEMLPMIVTTTLAKGAIAMSKEKTIIKNLNSIQNLGSMDILCTDKTGTLTQDKVVLEYHLNIHGEPDSRILKHAFLNSYYQTGLKNLMDKSIIQRTTEQSVNIESLRNLNSDYIKVDEVPFDFNRRRMSVVVQDKNKKTQMITKGAVEEMLSICSHVEYNGSVTKITSDIISNILETTKNLNQKGMRVIAVAQKTNPSPVDEFSIKDECDMVLMGYLAFLDPPKEAAAEAILALQDYGVTTKVLTGDNEFVTKSICEMIGIESNQIILGSDIDNMNDAELSKAVEQVNIFAKLSPMQKSRIVRMLRANGHTVGFLGDGINDSPAMKDADIGISVENAVDIAKESAEVILLEKDLLILEKGIIEGRKTYANMIKYIKMTASSNFGNVFSVLLASAFLPFLPMEPLHLILLNLIYDISCMSIPWDNVDQDYLKIPRKWDASSISNFMLILGPTSSVFDITTYLLMFFVISPSIVGAQFKDLTDPSMIALFIATFQAGWFIESMWTQTLVVHMLRTDKIPFLESRASVSVTLLTFIAIISLTLIPFTNFGLSIGLAPLGLNFFIYLGITVLLYMMLVTYAKKYFVKKHGELL